MSFLLPDFRIRQRDYLLEISRALTEELDLDTLLSRILSISIEMMAGQAGLIALKGGRGNWGVRVSQGIPAQFLKVIEASLAEIHENTLFDGHDIPVINRLLSELTYSASLGLLSGVGLPMSARNHVVGLITIFRSYQGNFSNNDRLLLSSFADQAAIAVQNAQLYRQVSNEKHRMDALLESAADGFLILQPDHKIERVNAAFSRLSGRPVAEMADKYHDDIILWATPPQGMTLSQAESGGWPLTPNAHLYVEGDLQRNNRLPPLPIGITYAPLISPEGTLLNIIATVRDITRFRQAEELKTTFISIISHELKTPVALIKGYVSTLRRDDATWDADIIKDSLAVIEEETDRLTLLIENLLDATRLQAGGISIKLADVVLPDLVNRLIKRFKIQSTRHEFKTDFPPDFPIVLADETRLEQVISNLLANAIKYSQGGIILICGTIRPEYVIICVSDQGPGIASEDIPHVFDRFYRAPELAKLTKGAGLGLFLSRSIIEAHKGKIWVDPRPKEGARICFSLPRPGEDKKYTVV